MIELDNNDDDNVDNDDDNKDDLPKEVENMVQNSDNIFEKILMQFVREHQQDCKQIGCGQY